MSTADPNDFFPVGAVIAFGGTLADNANWLPCDGRSVLVGDYPELLAVLQYTYGGTQGSVFNLPDYRGQFLRGVSHGTGKDPDAARRTSRANPPGPSDAVGTSQAWATHTPTVPFLANVPHLPTDSFGVSGETSSDAGPSGSTNMTTCDSGGDGDTRPVNVYVNFYIKAKSS